MILGSKKKNNSKNNEFEDLNDNRNIDKEQLDDLLNFYSDDFAEEEYRGDEDVLKAIKEAKKLNSNENVKITEAGYSNDYNDEKEIEDLNASEMLDISDNSNSSSNIESIDDISNTKKKKAKKNKEKKKRKGKDPGFVNIESPTMVGGDDFVIIQDNKKHFRGLKGFIKAIFAIIIFILLTILVYILLSFKFVPENVKGSDYYIKGISVISSNYKPNLDELKIGDEVICIKNDKLPFVASYDKYTCQSRNSYIIFAVDNAGNKKKLEANSIDYIIRK